MGFSSGIGPSLMRYAVLHEICDAVSIVVRRWADVLIDTVFP